MLKSQLEFAYLKCNRNLLTKPAVGEKPEGVWKQEGEHPKSRTCYYLLEKESRNSTSTLSLLLEERSPLVRAENLCKYLPTVRLDPLFVVTQCAAVITWRSVTATPVHLVLSLTAAENGNFSAAILLGMWKRLLYVETSRLTLHGLRASAAETKGTQQWLKKTVLENRIWSRLPRKS